MLINIGNIWQKWSLNIVKISAQKITTNSAECREPACVVVKADDLCT